MEKPHLSLWSLLIFGISVPLILGIMWIIETLFETPEKDSRLVQISAMVLICVSCLGTGIGFIVGIMSAIKEWPRGSGRIGCLPLVATVLNGFCFFLWAVLVITMIGSVISG